MFAEKQIGGEMQVRYVGPLVEQLVERFVERFVEQLVERLDYRPPLLVLRQLAAHLPWVV